MLNATRNPGSVRRTCAVGLVLFTLLTAPARAELLEPVVEGRFITVPNPITSEVTNLVKDATNRAIRDFKSARGGPDGAPRVLKIVYDFNPDGMPSGSPYFGPCRDLAEFLAEQPEVHTVAFVHAETTRHTVLPVLACRDLVMSSTARLGDVRRDLDPRKPLRQDVLVAYREAVKDRCCPAAVLKMLDPDMELVRAKKVGASGERYIDKRDAKVEETNGVFILDPNPVVGRGEHSTLYTTEQAHKLGLCTLRRETREEVAAAYGLPPVSLREDPLMGRIPVAWRIDVRGAVTEALAERVKRQVGRAVGKGANFIVLQLECGGGDTLVARDLADYLRERSDSRRDKPVMTVAYVPRTAPDMAVFLAFGCTHLVMHKDATFGDFSSVVRERRGGDLVDVPEEKYRAKRESLEGLAPAHAVLVRGLFDRHLEIYRARDAETGAWVFLDGEARKAPRWQDAEKVKEPGRLLVLTADMALKYGVAQHKVESLDELYAAYGISPSQVQVAEGDWLDDFAGFLRHPVTRFAIVMIGILCLVLELKVPGVTAPGIIAVVCFILFFWSHSMSAGLTLLALLLFLLGLALIGLEIFVIPGFGVSGVGGTLLIVFSLALAALEKRPQTSDEWLSLLRLMGQFGLGLIGAVAAAMTVAHYLPSIPLLNRLILRPAGEAAEDNSIQTGPPVRPEAAALLGAIGVAATPLRPSGKVQFGEQYIDVVAEGGYVTPGSRVQVVEVEGHRIVVKEVL